LITSAFVVFSAAFSLGLTHAAIRAKSPSSEQQGSSPPVRFEVASIKPTKPGTKGDNIRPMPGGQIIMASGVSLKQIIQAMYHLNADQVSGGPSWLDSDLWDIEAKAEKPSSTDELHEMFKTLLAERFKLQFHNETKEMNAYVLTVDKRGPKMKADDGPEQVDLPLRAVPGHAGLAKEVGTGESMTHFARWLSQLLSKPVADRTGLDGHYDFTLEWAADPDLIAKKAERDGSSVPEAAAPVNGPDIFAALRAQLGLRLQSGKGPVEFMAIDHVERPTAN
jgi:uncharacterized protein (TIGR03435 family)